MSQPLTNPSGNEAGLLGRLEEVCRYRDLAGWALRLQALRLWMEDDLSSIEEELTTLFHGPLAVQRSGRELLSLGGKRLRPLCVALAARLGSGFDPVARSAAVAVELIHNATLLHDDVVDSGEIRRGAPTARTVYGNTAAIFAGDWLLVEALRRIQRCRLDGLLDRALDTIEMMIEAEAWQLEGRRALLTSRDLYRRIVDGKTAALFRLALGAGAQAGQLGEPERRALEAYGTHLGLAFQLVDDLLDLEGDPEEIGKDPLADLREGRMTYPLLLALESRPQLEARLTEVLEGGDQGNLARQLLHEVSNTGALLETRELARREARLGLDHLEALPPGRVRRALATVAEASVERRR